MREHLQPDADMNEKFYYVGCDSSLSIYFDNISMFDKLNACLLLPKQKPLESHFMRFFHCFQNLDVAIQIRLQTAFIDP